MALRFQIAICLCTSILAACTSPSARVAVVKLVQPKTESDCVKSGGEWAKDFFGGYYCFLRTTDGGKRCTGSEQCQWVCLGPDDAVRGAKVVGACSETNSQLGHVVFVEDGKAIVENVE